ncbi:MAG: DegT/DnrJ/EryC1/StrS family aminotransferase [gamma proteobacterium symbiont of Bathyaustriella thionipta]|nr:DegT/DnrJ/EryC1/StrS family aminotransferase [gamma proteobacterium symbiont of Bathyaustriella thionipta]MCU7948705.1 DegT/DnrJ/EryC1/StrS family aminotransferase [gamma proteobacterium symbiont of Bathyaustriella thionipta]MCU7953882.1 DegT/DnrJ/EryC1/StrS family aminotransferase [gamma proteobacterium symbiont of Bathyaustriella thionipta]MCU7955022.1 DegT/DnrJ/EryC1/StrS family aminotransferase [gamma proteobacterium symbiont of Bathyaustriella thionipta]
MKRESYWQYALEALQRCQNTSGQVWIYTGSVQTLEYVLTGELIKETDKEISSKKAHKLAKDILERFCKQYNWLASLADDGNVWGDDDPEDAQLYKAVQRLSDGLLLTRDKRLLQRGSFAISPEQYTSITQEKKSIPFIELQRQQSLIRPQLEHNIHKVLHHGKYILGAEVQTLEEKLAEFVGVKHCIAVSSGTDALLIAMMALGIKQGDEVITTPFTFIATGEMIALLGAKPVFVDIDPRTYNIDPDKIEQAITTKTKAIMPVSLYGQCAEFDKINALAEKHQLPVIEDGAQSLGATYKGKQSCSLSTIGCTSFFPSKPLGGYGDSGACFTDNDELALLMRQIRVHGQDRRYHHPQIGINGRMDTLQAAILLAKLEIFPEEVEKRRLVGENYTKLIHDNHLRIISPHIEPYNTSVYAQYTIQVNHREDTIQKLNNTNIPTAVHYPVPLNQQPSLETKIFKLSIAEALSHKVMSLPMHPYLGIEEQKMIIQALC